MRATGDGASSAACQAFRGPTVSPVRRPVAVGRSSCCRPRAAPRRGRHPRRGQPGFRGGFAWRSERGAVLRRRPRRVLVVRPGAHALDDPPRHHRRGPDVEVTVRHLRDVGVLECGSQHFVVTGRRAAEPLRQRRVRGRLRPGAVGFARLAPERRAGLEPRREVVAPVVLAGARVARRELRGQRPPARPRSRRPAARPGVGGPRRWRCTAGPRAARRGGGRSGWSGPWRVVLPAGLRPCLNPRPCRAPLTGIGGSPARRAPGRRSTASPAGSRAASPGPRR